MVHIFSLLCFTSQIFGMNIIKEQSIEPFKQNNWDNRFAQLTTDQKNQLGLYLAAYENSPLAKESLPQFLLNGLGEIELGDDKLNTQKILFDGINNDNSKMVAYAFARGANSNSEQNNRSPLAQALLVSSDEICELLLEHKAEVSKELVQNAIYLEKTTLAWKFVQKKRELINEGFNTHHYDSQSGFLLGTHALLQGNFKIALEVISDKESPIGQITMDYIFNIIIKGLGDSKKHDYALKILEKIIEKGYPINNIWDYRKGQEHDGIHLKYLYVDDKTSIPYLYQKSVLELLIKHKADINHVIKIDTNVNHTWTPLLRSIAFNFKDTVEWLVENGADINQKAHPIRSLNRSPWSPLEFAVYLGRSEIAKLLTLKGAK